MSDPTTVFNFITTPKGTILEFQTYWVRTLRDINFFKEFDDYLDWDEANRDNPDLFYDYVYETCALENIHPNDQVARSERSEQPVTPVLLFNDRAPIWSDVRWLADVAPNIEQNLDYHQIIRLLWCLHYVVRGEGVTVRKTIEIASELNLVNGPFLHNLIRTTCKF